MLMTLNFVYPLTLAVLEIKIMMYQGRQAFHLLRQPYACLTTSKTNFQA